MAFASGDYPLIVTGAMNGAPGIRFFGTGEMLVTHPLCRLTDTHSSQTTR